MPPTDATTHLSGLGLLTPLGHSPWATLRALLDGRTTADRVPALQPGTDPTEIAIATASIPHSALSYEDPAVALAEKAASQALDDAGLAGVDLTVLASSKGAVHTLSAPRTTGTPPPSDISHAIVTQTPHGYLAHQLRERLASRADLGTIACPVAACATSLVALDHAVRALRSGRARSVLVIAVESALTVPFVQGYRRLGVLAPSDPLEAHRCRPLNRDRDGFTLCECAAAVVLTLDPPERAHATIHRTAVGTEPYDLLRAPREFSTLNRLASAVTDGAGSLALVHPHATGTKDNDERELRALDDALGSATLGTRVYASKGALGHPMGASGLVNVVLSGLIARTGTCPPMPWLDSPIESRFSARQAAQAIPRGAHVVVSGGFGGHTAAACLLPA